MFRIKKAAAVSAAAVSQNFKSKDEITLDIILKQPAGETVLNQKFTAKAKSDGDDIISKGVEQIAQAIANKAGGLR